MKKFSALLLQVLCALLLALPTLASSVVSPSGDYVSDLAGVLSAEAKEHINRNAKALDEATGAQIVFVTVETTKPTPIDDYAYKLFNTWKIGDAAKNNGLLVLLAIGDDNYYTMEGTGLERNLPTETLSALWNEYLEPDFAKKDYSAASVRYFDALFNRVSKLYGANLGVDVESGEPIAWTKASNSNPGASNGPDSFDVMMGLIIFGAFVVLIISIVTLIRSEGGGGGYTRSWSNRNDDDDSGSGWSGGSSSSSSGSGSFTSSSSSSSSSGSSSRSSGGFSGGGGESRGAGGGRGR